METGDLARLPDGQPVKIEIVHDDGYATVRRTKGRRAGEIAVCEVSRLEPAENLDLHSDR